MIYQLRWKILPGLRGLSCSEFRGAPTSAPDQDQGVAVAFASEAERDAFLQQLEEHFLGQHFSNQAVRSGENVRAGVERKARVVLGVLPTPRKDSRFGR